MLKTSLKVLKSHVRESNLIEGITAEPGEPLYDQHLEAARYIAETSTFIHPIEIHRLLFKGISGYDAGDYRTNACWVGAHLCPNPEIIGKHMELWEYAASDYVTDPLGHTPVTLHDWFLCIHPFKDGNGRTARLIFNMFRRLNGLSWITVRKSQLVSYLLHIRIWEKLIFEKMILPEFLP